MQIGVSDQSCAPGLASVRKCECLRLLSVRCCFRGWVLLFLGYLVNDAAGAVMLHMWRCVFAVFVAIMWRVCFLVGYARACLRWVRSCCPSCPSWCCLSCSICSPLLLSLSLSLCLSQPQPVKRPPTGQHRSGEDISYSFTSISGSRLPTRDRWAICCRLLLWYFLFL